MLKLFRRLINLSEVDEEVMPGLNQGDFWQEVDVKHNWLFLDIDGVLHRGENGTLEFMSMLSAVLDECEDTRIILSTNWRIVPEREQVLRHFPVEVRKRIVGSNPDLDGKVSEFVRYHECMAVVTQFGLKRYTFLDDTARLFPHPCDALFLTPRHEGLNQEHSRALIARLKSL